MLNFKGRSGKEVLIIWYTGPLNLDDDNSLFMSKKGFGLELKAWIEDLDFFKIFFVGFVASWK